MREIHRTEIVVTFRRVILVGREQSTDSTATKSKQTPLIVVNDCEADLEPDERRRVLREVVRILASYINRDPT